MNQLVGKDDNGRDFVIFVLEPGNIHRLQKNDPIELRLEDLFPNGIPRKLNVVIFYSETPIADAKEMRRVAKITFDERTPHTKNIRPHCPECRSTIEQLGVSRNESPVAVVFCAQCGCTLGIVQNVVVSGLEE